MTSPSEPVARLGLPTVTRNCLAYNGVLTVADLLDKTPRDLLRMVNIGPKTVAAIQGGLERHNFKLRDAQA